MVSWARGRKTRFLAVAATGMLLLSGCTGGPSSGNAGSGTKGDGKLVVSTAQGGIPQLDPGAATLQWERVLYPLLWDGLTKINKEGEVAPDLATEWTSSPDLMTWTFTLRDGVTFSNGRSLEAKDIVWNLQRVMDPKNAAIASSYLRPVYASSVASSEKQVVITLSKPNSVLPMALSALRIVAPESVDVINTKPIGTGPFQVSNFVPDQNLSLVRNENYWGTKPKLDKIDIVASHDPAAAVTAVRTNDIQVLWNVATSDAKPLEQDSSLSLVKSTSSTQMQYLAVDNTSAPFNNPKARQALSYALDRKATVDIAFSGYGEAALYSEPVPTDSWSFDETQAVNYATDLDKASELFEEAGVHKGDTLTWWGIAGGYPEWNKEAQLLQQNLAKIGINLSIQNNEVGTWVSKFVPRGKQYPGVIVPNAGGDPNDPSFAYDRIVNCECNYGNPAFAKLAEDGRTTSDQSKRAGVYGQMLSTASSELPKIFVVHVPVLAVTRSTVSGVWVAPTGDLHLEDAGLGE